MNPPQTPKRGQSSVWMNALKPQRSCFPTVLPGMTIGLHLTAAKRLSDDSGAAWRLPDSMPICGLSETEKAVVSGTPHALAALLSPLNQSRIATESALSHQVAVRHRWRGCKTNTVRLPVCGFTKRMVPSGSRRSHPLLRHHFPVESA